MLRVFGKLEDYLELGRKRATAEWRDVWTEFNPKERAIYFSEVSRRRILLGLPKIQDGISRTFFTDLEVGFRSAALQEAEKITHRTSQPARLKWIREKMADKSFLGRMADNFVFDEAVDRLLGLNERKLKRHLTSPKSSLPVSYTKEDTYLDSPPEDLYTPYRVLQEVMERLRPKSGERLVDLGSGLGRVGAYLGLFHTGVAFEGYEIVKERHHQAEVMAKHLKIQDRVHFFCEDISDSKWAMPEANYYFLFNPFSLRTLLKVLDKIRQVSNKRVVRIITVQIGRPPRQLKKVSWLKESWKSAEDEKWPGRGVTLYESLPTKK
jgi:hypothetical protein